MKGWRPSGTVIVYQSAGHPSDGYYLHHNHAKYGPWAGHHADGATIDIWDVHDWAVKNLGVCAFHNGLRPCDDECQRPAWAEKLAEEERRAAWRPPEQAVQLTMKRLLERLHGSAS